MTKFITKLEVLLKTKGFNISQVIQYQNKGWFIKSPASRLVFLGYNKIDVMRKVLSLPNRRVQGE